MLIAAMVLGILVGVGELFGGAASLIDTISNSYEDLDWVAIAIIPLGAIAIAGGLYIWRRIDIAAYLLLFSAVGNFIVGLSSIPRQGIGYVMLIPTVLLALAGAFALAKKWKQSEEG
jgi:hypothetical protein